MILHIVGKYNMQTVDFEIGSLIKISNENSDKPAIEIRFDSSEEISIIINPEGQPEIIK